MAQNALRLAKSIGLHHAGAAIRRVVAPPAVDFGENLRLRPPTINRQAESRFRDETIATHRLEGLACPIRLKLVVARRDPDLAPIFDAYLRRPQNMSGRMERDFHAVPFDRFPVANGFNPNFAESPTQDWRAVVVAKIDGAAEARVIGMAVGDDRPFDGAPRIDKKIAGRAIKPLRARDDQVHGRSVARALARIGGNDIIR